MYIISDVYACLSDTANVCVIKCRLLIFPDQCYSWFVRVYSDINSRKFILLKSTAISDFLSFPVVVVVVSWMVVAVVGASVCNVYHLFFV